MRAGARAVILSPSRELALQTHKVVKELGRYTDLRTAVLVGGDSMEAQVWFPCRAHLSMEFSGGEAVSTVGKQCVQRRLQFCSLAAIQKRRTTS